MAKTVLVKTYRGTGRPESFEVVSSENEKRINILIEGYQFSILEENLPDNFNVKKAWDKYTINDRDGYTQWKRRDNGFLSFMS